MAFRSTKPWNRASFLFDADTPDYLFHAYRRIKWSFPLDHVELMFYNPSGSADLLVVADQLKSRRILKVPAFWMNSHLFVKTSGSACSRQFRCTDSGLITGLNPWPSGDSQAHR